MWCFYGVDKKTLVVSVSGSVVIHTRSAVELQAARADMIRVIGEVVLPAGVKDALENACSAVSQACEGIPGGKSYGKGRRRALGVI